MSDFPRHKGFGRWELSDGSEVSGTKESAVESEAELAPEGVEAQVEPKVEVPVKKPKKKRVATKPESVDEKLAVAVTEQAELQKELVEKYRGKLPKVVTPQGEAQRELWEKFKDLTIPSEWEKSYGNTDQVRKIVNAPEWLTFYFCTPPSPEYGGPGDGGGLFARAKSLGYSPVTKDQVTTDGGSTDKFILRTYEIINDYVVIDGAILMVALTEHVEARKAANLQAMEVAVHRRLDGMKGEGFEVETTTTKREYNPLGVYSN